MYSARPTLLTDTLAHVKQSGEGTQREGDSSALTVWLIRLYRKLYTTTVTRHRQFDYK